MKRAASREAGFALAESIAVLALSALVLLTLLIATDLVSRNSAAAARRANDLEMLATGLAAVRRDLEGALYVQDSGGAESSLVLFTGRSDAVGAVVQSDRSGRGNRESLIWIETRYEDGQGALIRSSAPLLPETSGFAGVEFGDSVLLAVGPWQYRFSYAGEGSGVFAWTAIWSGKLPAAIRLEVLDGSGERVLPSLTVRVQVNTGSCAGGDCGGEEAAAAEEGDAQSIRQ